MTSITEETAVDLLNEIMILNANIKDLTTGLAKLIDDISPHHNTTEQDLEKEDTITVNSVETERTLSEEEDDDLPEPPKVSEHKKKYHYFGPEQFDPKVPVPECFGRQYDSPQCIKVKDKCSWKDLCADIPPCYVEGYGSDDCLTKIEECEQAERCSNLHADQTDYDPRMDRLTEFAETVISLKDQK
jgi:hypothetical protein